MNLNSSDWPYLIYSLILLSLLIMGLVSRRDLSFSKTFKYIAIWLGIAAITIIFYSYRYELSSFKNRILGEIIPAQARINKQGQIIINASQDGHFYMNSTINGFPVKFMIDTGASDIVLNLKDAANSGINIRKLNFNRRYQTANGISLGAKVTLEEMKVGNISFQNVPASVNNANMGTSLLGMSFLQQCKKYEFYQDKLILTFYQD